MLLPSLVFIVVVAAVAGAYVAASRLPAMLASRRLGARLRDVSAPAAVEEAAHETVVMRQVEGPWPSVDRLVARTRAGSRLAALIEQSGCRTTPSAIVLITLTLAGAAALVALLTLPLWYVAPIAAIVAGAMPTAYLMFRRSRRMKAFEELFPEALDLLSRALRAGHAFQSALGMVADELKAPVGPEFKTTFDRQNYGLPLREALDQMAERVPILDVRFFVTAVLIQRETGGNLSEILDTLARVVRERFMIRRQIRTHTAHGRFTAFVLLSMPPGLAVALMIINPDHMNLLFHEPIGQTVLMAALAMQAVGFVWIRKVIKIEV
jgi:tight adherence protein B